MKEFEEQFKNLDFSTLFVLFDSEKTKSQNVFQHVFLPIFETTRDYIRVYAFDCREKSTI